MLSSKLYETQSHLMLTGHIMNAQLIVINEKVWQKLDPDAARRAERGRAGRAQARERDGAASQEAEETEKLKGLKMNVIGPDNGLKLDVYKAAVNKVVQEKFGAKFGDLYKEDRGDQVDRAIRGARRRLDWSRRSYRSREPSMSRTICPRHPNLGIGRAHDASLARDNPMAVPDGRGDRHRGADRRDRADHAADRGARGSSSRACPGPTSSRATPA